MISSSWNHYSDPVTTEDFPRRLLLAETDQFVSAALKYWFSQFRFVKECEVVRDYPALLERVNHWSPALVLLPDHFGQISGMTAGHEIRRYHPETAVVYLIGNISDQMLNDLMHTQPAGIITRNSAPEEIINVIRRVLAGMKAYTSGVRERMNRLVAQPGIRKKGGDGLSLRQKEVLRYLALGHTVKEVAAIMHLSVKSIDSHKYRIMKKLNLHDRVHLARYAIREGLLEA